MATKCFETLEFGIEHQLAANALVCVTGQRYEIPIKLIAHAQPPEAEPGFYVELLEAAGSLIDDVIDQSLPVEICFRTETARVFFDTTITRKKKNHWINRQVLLRYPSEVQAVEQRNSDREYIPDHIRVLARVALEQPRADIDAPDFPCRVMDISPGGASLICPRERALALLEPGDALQIAISFDTRSPIRLAAEHRYLQQLSTNSLRVGLQFDTQAVSPATAAAFDQLLTQLETLRMRTFHSTVAKRLN